MGLQKSWTRHGLNNNKTVPMGNQCSEPTLLCTNSFPFVFLVKVGLELISDGYIET